MKGSRAPGYFLLVHFAKLLATCLVLATLLACATMPPKAPRPDVLALLDPGALAFVRLEAPMMALILPQLAASTSSDAGAERKGSKQDDKALGDLVARTRVAGLAILPKPRTPDKEQGSGQSPAPPSFEAVLDGDFPPLGLSLALSFNQGWRREGQSWRRRSGPLAGLGIFAGGSNRLLAASGDLEPLRARAADGGRDPLPARLATRRPAPLLVWFPDPLHRALARLDKGSGLFSEMSLPLEGILVLGQPGPIKAASAEEANPALEIELIILMKDSDSARLYLPAARIALALVERNFRLDGSLEGASKLTRDGDRILVSGLSLRVSALAAALIDR